MMQKTQVKLIPIYISVVLKLFVAVDHLSGFNVCGRYLIVLYYQATRMQQRVDTTKKQKELNELK
jgi:hypothetical protein